MRFKSVIIAFILSTNVGWGQSNVDSIDVKFNSCIDTSFSTYNMLMCIEEAMEKWNVKLDSTYKTLINKLDSARKQGVIKSQKSWGAYFDDQVELWESFNENVSHAWDYDRYYIMIGLVRARNKVLESYLYSIGE